MRRADSPNTSRSSDGTVSMLWLDGSFAEQSPLAVRPCPAFQFVGTRLPCGAAALRRRDGLRCRWRRPLLCRGCSRLGRGAAPAATWCPKLFNLVSPEPGLDEGTG